MCQISGNPFVWLANAKSKVSTAATHFAIPVYIASFYDVIDLFSGQRVRWNL
jgi:hypothetical protein